MNNEKIVYMRWVAYELRKRGFRILRTDINPKKPQFDCYVFEDTPEFRAAFEEIANR